MSKSLGECKKVFQCPTCKQFNPAEANRCRYCLFLVPVEIRDKEVYLQEQKDKEMRLNIYRHLLSVGLGGFVVSSAFLIITLLALFLFDKAYIHICLPVIIVIYLGHIISGLYGIYRERK